MADVTIASTSDLVRPDMFVNDVVISEVIARRGLELNSIFGGVSK